MENEFGWDYYTDSSKYNALLYNVEVKEDGKRKFVGDLDCHRLKALIEYSEQHRDALITIQREGGGPAYIFLNGREYAAEETSHIQRRCRPVPECEEHVGLGALFGKFKEASGRCKVKQKRQAFEESSVMD